MLDGYGNVLHFPAGGYQEHMRDGYSQTLLSLVLYAKNAENIFRKLKDNDNSVTKAGLNQRQNRFKNRIIAWEKENLTNA